MRFSCYFKKTTIHKSKPTWLPLSAYESSTSISSLSSSPPTCAKSNKYMLLSSRMLVFNMLDNMQTTYIATVRLIQTHIFSLSCSSSSNDNDPSSLPPSSPSYPISASIYTCSYIIKDPFKHHVTSSQLKSVFKSLCQRLAYLVAFVRHENSVGIRRRLDGEQLRAGGGGGVCPTEAVVGVAHSACLFFSVGQVLPEMAAAVAAPEAT